MTHYTDIQANIIVGGEDFEAVFSFDYSPAEQETNSAETLEITEQNIYGYDEQLIEAAYEYIAIEQEIIENYDH